MLAPMIDLEGLSGEQVRAIRGKATGAVFGGRVRQAVADILGVDVRSVPEVSYTQVSRWEARGLDPTARKLPTLLYLVALYRVRDGG